MVQCLVGVGWVKYFTVNTARGTSFALMLVHGLRRWPKISPVLDQYVVFAGLSSLQRVVNVEQGLRSVHTLQNSIFMIILFIY